jgi:subtilisin family serine protease
VKPRQLRFAALLCAVVLGFALLPLSGEARDSRQAISASFEDGTVLVGFKAGVSAGGVARVEQQEGAVEADVRGAGTHVVRVASGQVASKIAALRRHPEVRYAEPNYILHADAVPNDPRFSELWGLQNTGQPILGFAGKPGADISATQAWNLSTGSASIVVGVVDTGIDYNHPDLSANVWNNLGGVGGCPAGTHGYNAIARTCNPMDDNNHGSHVSGTIGAVGNNAVGVVGVNWTTSIMGLKFLDASGSGTTANAITAIDFAVNAKIAGVNVRVLSNSWGGGGFSQALLDEINKANANDILFVAAAGNSSANNDVTPHYPSSYNTPNMVAVAATDSTDSLAYFSNYGPTSVHLGAPGDTILSTIRSGGYDYFSGTSMATPHVSGTAALVLSRANQTTANLKSLLLTNVDPLPSLAGLVSSGGRLNAYKAVSAAGPPPPPDFSLSTIPTSQTVVQGSSTSYTINISRTNFTAAVTLSVSGLPSGGTGTFNPNPASGTSSTLSVTTASSTPTGTYALTITGTGGTLTRTTSASLVVTATPPPDFSLGVTPASQSVVRGASTTYTVNITRSGGFTASVTLAISGLPAGASGTFSPNPAAANSSTLTVTTTTTTTLGSFVFTVTGTSGTLSRTATATLVVNAAPADDCNNCQ